MAQLGSRWQQGKQMVERGQVLQREGQFFDHKVLLEYAGKNTHAHRI